MTGRLGRVLAGGRDRGGGFALGPRLVVTAYHVVRNFGTKPVVYVPAGGEPVEVERVQPDAGRDAAILWLVSDVGEFLPTSAAVREAEWRVVSPPPGSNDPELHGTVTAARKPIQNASGEPVEVVQLEVDQQLGDFEGYSGSAVLDSLGRAVFALLVEQKPLRTPVALGERRAASNVLYAVPIGDVITANGLAVRTFRPLRFDVGLLPPGMVARPGPLDEAVGRVIDAEGGEAGAGLVLLRGPGGLGKTVLARQVADDVRVWAEFPDGIIMIRAGQTGTADGVARQLQETLGCPYWDLAGVLGGQRMLLIVDDVWNRELLGTLRANLPPTVTVLATTRGVAVPGAVTVLVGALSRDEAIQILARSTPRSDEFDRALGDLAQTLFRWALLLTLAAAEIHCDDELGWEPGDEDSSQPRAAEPDVIIERANTLRAEFSRDPTMLDDRERTPESAAPRSVEVLVRRSLDWLGPEHQALFELLAIYPPGATITQPMLEDLWETSQKVTRKEIMLLARAGLAQPVWTDRLTIELHDLITAWLHHKRGHPGDTHNQPIHQRLAGLCMLPDGSLGKLTGDQAEWLAYHLVSADAWDKLKALPTLRWRNAFLVATGSDAVFLAGLDLYAHAAVAQAPNALYHAVRAWLFAAHVRALIGRLPIPLLVAMAVVGDPIAGITQAGQHPSAGEAIPAVLAAVADRLDTRVLAEQAVAMARTIPDDRERSKALAEIAACIAAIHPLDPALTDEAVAIAGTIPDHWRGIPDHRERDWALAAIAERLAAADPRDPAVIDQALAVAGIMSEWGHSKALAAIAERLAAAGTEDPALLDQALAVAAAIPRDQDRSEALAAVAGRLAVIDPVRAVGLVGQALAVAGTVSDEWGRSKALAAIAERLAAAGTEDPALVDQAVAVAATIPDDQDRSEALAAIAGRLAVVDRARAASVAKRALVVAASIPGDRERSWALAAIAERLANTDLRDPALTEQALVVARTILGDQERSGALACIAEWLASADPRDRALVDQAVAVAGTIPRDQERDEALVAIAKRLAAAGSKDPALVDQALAVAGTISDERDHSKALAGIAEWLASADPRDRALVDQAVAVAGTIPRDQERSEALAAIAERLAAIDPAQTTVLIERVLAVAGTIPRDQDRDEALAGIAERLAAADPLGPALVDHAAAVARTIPDRWRRNKVLTGIADRLAAAGTGDPALVDEAVAVAGTISEEWDRSKALAGIADRLATADPGNPALIDQAVAVARTIPDGQERSEALAAIARRLAVIDPTQITALIGQALAMAGSIPVDHQRSWALAGIAKQLTVIDPVQAAALVEQALGVARATPDDQERSAALAGIAERLASADPTDPALIEQALAVAGTISDEWARNWALADIAEGLAGVGSEDPALIDQAVAVARTISDVWGRSAALAGIARLLSSGNPPDPALIEKAVEMAVNTPGEWERGEALAGIAEALAAVDPLDPALIGKAVEVAGTIPASWERSKALAGIGKRLAAADPNNPALIEWALAVAGAIPDHRRRSEVVTLINGLTKSRMLHELSRWRFWPLGVLIDLVNMSLANPDKTTAETIGLAVLDVAREFSPKM
jgi:hypothetical protein